MPFGATDLQRPVPSTAVADARATLRARGPRSNSRREASELDRRAEVPLVLEHERRGDGGAVHPERPASRYRVDAQRLEVVGDVVLGEGGDSRIAALPVA